MAGRYFDWTHIRVQGAPREAGAPYIPAARKLLGEVFEQAEFNGLGVHKMRRILPDGTVIIAEKHGEIPRVTIAPLGRAGGGARRTVEGFYLTWAGADPDTTPILFHEPSGDPEGDDFRDWKASFFNSDAYGYDDVPEDRRGATYMDVFGTAAKERVTRMLAGGGVWYDRDTGEAVTWFRGYDGYWPQHHRHPRTLYSNSISIYGHIVFAIGNGWHVMAAAKREGYLYVIFGQDLGVNAPPAPSGIPAYSGQVWFSQPYVDADYTYSLWRIPLAVVVEPDTGIETYRGDGDNATLLWQAALPLMYGAWSFNADCTKCVSMQLPRVAAWCWVQVDDGSDWVPSSVEDSSYPEVEARRLEVTIDHESEAPTASAVWGVRADLIAEEDGHQLEIVEHTRSDDYDRIDYKLGEFTVPAAEKSSAGGVLWYDRRVLLHAHLPSQTLLFHRWRTDVDPVRHVTAGFELYVAGELVEIDDPSALDEAFAGTIYDAATAGNALYKKGVSYDNGSGTSWFRPIDAMTFLLGYTFQTPGAPSTGATGQPGFGYQTCPYVAYVFNDASLLPHAAAGGYVFGSVGGPAANQFWGTSFPVPGVADPFGANAGDFTDLEPSTTPTIASFGSAASTAEHTLAALAFQPLLGVAVGGTPTALTTLTNQFRALQLGTGGDAETILSPMLGVSGEWPGFALSHTGAPRPSQRGVFKAPQGA